MADPLTEKGETAFLTFWESVFRTCMTRPEGMFTDEQLHADSVLLTRFVVFNAILGGALYAVTRTTLFLLGIESSVASLISGVAGAGYQPLFFGSFLAYVLFWVTGAFMFAGMQWVFMHFVGGRGSTHETFAVIAYASVLAVLMWFPAVNLAVLIYFWYVVVVGLASAHNVSRMNAFVASLLLPVVFISLLSSFTALFTVVFSYLL